MGKQRTAGARVAVVLAALLVSLFFVTTANAESPTKGKSGIEAQSFGQGNYTTHGLMFGYRSQRYVEHQNLSFGIEMLAGSPGGGNLEKDNLAYGGLTLGYDGTLAQIFSYDFSIMGGYGFGRIDRDNIGGHSFAIQPTVALGLTLIMGYRASFAVGYLLMPNANGFSRMTFGIRLEQKTDSYANGVDN